MCFQLFIVLINCVVTFNSVCDKIGNHFDHVPLVMTLNINNKYKCLQKIKSAKKLQRVSNQHVKDYRFLLDICLLITILYLFILSLDCLLCVGLMVSHSVQQRPFRVHSIKIC